MQLLSYERSVAFWQITAPLIGRKTVTNQQRTITQFLWYQQEKSATDLMTKRRFKIQIYRRFLKYSFQKPNALLCYLNQLLYDSTQKHLLSKVSLTNTHAHTCYYHTGQDLGDFIINFYYKHAPNLLPDALIHSQFLCQYSLGKCTQMQTRSNGVILFQVGHQNQWSRHTSQAVSMVTRAMMSI